MILLLTFCLALPTGALAKTEIQWWHAMTGFLGEKVNEITQKFNASQTEYEV
ncbi:MAG: sn-glycerol-3-phosphate ABC transporter substrate-binding protein, partial [Thermodesulfobacteriota bacterium]|nr:sn-glycerol-3-phosphate ABC transporter substrate-binding protein [Thermodesulfobacteriota bacterium]